MPKKSLPILYSFRRCPYAMRARMALHYASIKCMLREVSLKNKPQSMLDISPKGTVPVLLLQDGVVIDESLDIIHYALAQNDPEGINQTNNEQVNQLIARNDTEFAKLLRMYKYFDRHPENTQKEYRQQIELEFLENYEQMLGEKQFLLSTKSIADIAILPFIRQFAYVDEDWFFTSKYKNLINWLNMFTMSESFEHIIMAKHTPWQRNDEDVIF